MKSDDPDGVWAAELDKATGSEIEDWLTALASSPLDCMSRSFKLLTELRGLQPSQDQLEEALFGPWRYQDKGNPYGLDPEALQFGAFTEDDPRVLAKKRPVVLGAIWLALQAIPFFTGKRDPFRWCVWTTPLSADAAKLLLASGVIEGESYESRARRGIPMAFESERIAIKEGKNVRFSLRRASLLA